MDWVALSTEGKCKFVNQTAFVITREIELRTEVKTALIDTTKGDATEYQVLRRCHFGLSGKESFGEDPLGKGFSIASDGDGDLIVEERISKSVFHLCK